MIVILSAVLGAACGAVLARRRGGNRLDMAQYAGAFGILFSIIGIFVTIAINRALN